MTLHLLHVLKCGGTVHLRHAVIQEDTVISCLLDHGQTFLTAGRGIDLNLCLFEKAFDHREVHGRIVHNQDPGLRCAERLMIGRSAGGMRAIAFLQITDGFGIQDHLRDLDTEGTALSVNTVHLYAAAHKRQKALGDRQSETGSLDRPVLVHIDPLEGAEQLAEILLPDPDPGIDDVDPEYQRIIIQHIAVHRKCHAAARRILHRVVEQIDHDLTDAHLISVEGLRQRLIDIQFKRQMLLRDLALHQVHDIIDDRGEAVLHQHDLHAPCLDLGEIQDIVDQG